MPYAAFMFFRECLYTPVQSPANGWSYDVDMIDLDITDEMAQKVLDGQKLTLLDFLFLPNQYQMIRVRNS